MKLLQEVVLVNNNLYVRTINSVLRNYKRVGGSVLARRKMNRETGTYAFLK